MTLTTTVIRRGIKGCLRFVSGKCTSDGTGGDIATGLRRVENFTLTPIGTAVQTNAPVVNESFPTTDGTITIVTDSSASFSWVAEGR